MPPASLIRTASSSLVCNGVTQRCAYPGVSTPAAQELRNARPRLAMQQQHPAMCLSRRRQHRLHKRLRMRHLPHLQQQHPAMCPIPAASAPAASGHQMRAASLICNNNTSDAPYPGGVSTGCVRDTECATSLVCNNNTQRCAYPGGVNTGCVRDTECAASPSATTTPAMRLSGRWQHRLRRTH